MRVVDRFARFHAALLSDTIFNYYSASADPASLPRRNGRELPLCYKTAVAYSPMESGAFDTYLHSAGAGCSDRTVILEACSYPVPALHCAATVLKPG